MISYTLLKFLLLLIFVVQFTLAMAPKKDTSKDSSSNTGGGSGTGSGSSSSGQSGSQSTQDNSVGYKRGSSGWKQAISDGRQIALKKKHDQKEKDAQEAAKKKSG